MTANRPPGQRWIKRPPRPSRTTLPGPPPRVGPGVSHLLMAIATGVATGIVGVVLAQLAGARAGVPGFAAGLGFILGFIVLWRGFGGTRQDIRNLFK
ncbi:hypothetical protein [Falsiroseomonas sp.]|uniref:hypothetical protein n=1 Tax=Falsiroseomonas sp. TaxID=2870721 RepID=UPI003F71C423